MPGRKYLAGNSAQYRYSINGQEKESELNENITTAQFWEYDSRIVRRWNIDPSPNVSISPYNCFAGNPIWFSDNLGDSIGPGRTKGMNFIVVANKALRDRDIAQPDHGKIGSAYNIDYKRASAMARKSHGKLQLIEAADEQDAATQIKNRCGTVGYIANLIIDFHKNSDEGEISPFSNESYNSGCAKGAFRDLASQYIGIASNVYLGNCWAGGNSKVGGGERDLTLNTSQWSDGATSYGQQAAASSFGFLIFRTFYGPVFESWAHNKANQSRKGWHTVSYFEPQIKGIRSVEIKDRMKFSMDGTIHMRNKIALGYLNPIIPYESNSQPVIQFTPNRLENIPPPSEN
jgi:hypothetical protein